MPKRSRTPDWMFLENFDPDGMPDQRTYVIFGMPRGGTTMVAGVSSLLGLNLGEDLPRNLEDQNFNFESLNGTVEEKRAYIRDEIRSRNLRGGVWGWKYPDASRYLDHVMDDLVNPHFVIVFRDFTAQGYRMRRRTNSPITQMLQTYIRRLRATMLLLEKWNCPTLALSYEKCVSESDVFVPELARFLGQPEPEEAQARSIAEFMHPGSYKDIEKFHQA